MSDITDYKKLCDNESRIPIFSSYWWLDAVCGDDNWDVVLLKRNDEIIASMPYFFRNETMKLIMMPKFTPKLGPWLKYPPCQKYTSKLSFEKTVLNELIKKLPKFNIFIQNFDYSFHNILPFYWNDFDSKVGFTYIIEDLTDLDKVYSNFSSNLRRNIRKAKELVDLEDSDSLEDLFTTINLTYKRQNKKNPVNYSLFKKIDSICKTKNCRKIFLARDADNKLHAGIYLIWDENSAYYLIGGGDPVHRNSGAMSYLMWEAIKHASLVTLKFDFEGSSIHSIERFFSSFGAIQKTYFQVYKPSVLVSILYSIRKHLK